MKFPPYLFFVALLGLFFSSPNLTFAQEAEVPAKIKAQFIAEYPVADNANWRLEEDGSFECAFNIEGMERGVVYAANGDVLSRVAALKQAGLPAAIQDYVTENLSGFDFREAYKLEEGSLVIYEVEFESDVEQIKFEFDGKGKLVNKDQKNIDQD